MKAQTIQSLGRSTFIVRVYEPKSEHNAIVLGDLNDAQRHAIYEAGCESLPL
jgi:hypothetical protein